MRFQVVAAVVIAAMTSSALTAPQVTAAPTDEVTAAAACIGNGTAGNRVQLMYVRQQSQPSRLAVVTPQMREWAEQIDRMFLEAATATGGFRRVRWVTGADCLPTVVEHVLPAGVTDFGRMLVALGDAGLRPVDRKLLIAHDDQAYCGFGEVEPDDRPGPENRNNTQTQALGGAVSEICWGFPAAAHELVHTLGAVQESAPHGTAARHCTDQFELMCQFDSSGEPMVDTCPRSNAQRLDCDYDDYFNVDPPPGSYLATHWNIADSSFLDTAEWFLPPDRPESPKVTAGSASAVLTWEPPGFDGGTPVTGYLVTVHPSERVIRTGPRTELRIGGLADGDPVWLTVQATTAFGTGASSVPTDTVTPTPRITARTRLTGAAPRAVTSIASGTTWFGTERGLLRVDPVGKRKLLSGPGALARPLRERTPLRRTPMRPVALALHPGSGELYVADRLSGRVRRVDDGKVVSVTPPRITPAAIAFDSRGRLLVADASAHQVWRRGADGVLRRIAGSARGSAGFDGDGGQARAALLRAPRGLAADDAGNVYVADRGNHRVRRIGPGGAISTFAGNGADAVGPGIVFDGTDAIFLLLPRPTGITVGGGRLFVQSASRIVSIGPDRTQVTYVGSPGMPGDSGDGGPARHARISDDVQLSWSGGRLVVLDRLADRVRRVARPAR